MQQTKEGRFQVTTRRWANTATIIILHYVIPKSDHLLFCHSILLFSCGREALEETFGPVHIFLRSCTAETHIHNKWAFLLGVIRGWTVDVLEIIWNFTILHLHILFPIFIFIIVSCNDSIPPVLGHAPRFLRHVLPQCSFQITYFGSHSIAVGHVIQDTPRRVVHKHPRDLAGVFFRHTSPFFSRQRGLRKVTCGGRGALFVNSARGGFQDCIFLGRYSGGWDPDRSGGTRCVVAAHSSVHIFSK
mmetsp:Transcript_52156/g.156548  ORF Transcript_52156/g.156548 Transcript_52156/m.156548 type:complete len:245 (-) Transcript_52156:195-929(-)